MCSRRPAAQISPVNYIPCKFEIRDAIIIFNIQYLEELCIHGDANEGVDNGRN